MNIKYGYLEKDKLDFYNTLDIRRKKYIDFRGQGYNKTEAYKLAGYNSKNASQGSHNLEKGNIATIIEDIINHNKLNQLVDGEGKLKQQIDALTTSKQAKKALEVIDKATGEEARRIQFYNDISTGKSKTIEKTTIKDRDGNVKEERIVEKEPTITERMNARKQLDILLGLSNMPSEVGHLQAGQITITIVDASNKEELADSRNKVSIDADYVELPKSDDEDGDSNE